MCEPTSEIVKFYENQTIFLTGGTGLLGKVLLEKLLRTCPNVRKIYVLIRPKKGKNVQERFESLFDSPCFDRVRSDDLGHFRSKVSAISGDCNEPNLNLTDEDAEVLRAEVTVLIHAAADVKFDQTLRSATRNILRATRDVLRLAHAMPNLKTFLYVSTAFSNCPLGHIRETFYEPPFTPEQILNVVDAIQDEKLMDEITPTLLGKWPNTYVFVKSITEHLIKSEGEGLPLAVVRPAIVSSTADEPFPGWIDNFYGIAGIIVAACLGVLRTLNAKSEIQTHIVPVDKVGNCVLAVAYKTAKENGSPNAQNRIYNYAGDAERNPFTWGMYERILNRTAWPYFSEKVIWYYSMSFSENIRWHNFMLLVLHTIPAHIVDFVFTCVGRPAIAVAQYRRLHRLLAMTSYFTMNKFSFEMDNVTNLWEELNEEDKKLFNFTMRDLDWEKYSVNSFIGGRVHLLKDPISKESLRRGQVKRYKLTVAYYALKFIFYYLCYKLVAFIYRAIF